MSRHLGTLALLSLCLAACGPVKNLDPLGGLAGPQDSSRYGFEASTQGWGPSSPPVGSCLSVQQASGRSFFGQGSLAFYVSNLGGLDPNIARVSVLFSPS